MAICREGLEAYPGNPFILYNVACLENLLGRPDDALATLATAVEAWPPSRSLRARTRTSLRYARIPASPQLVGYREQPRGC